MSASHIWFGYAITLRNIGILGWNGSILLYAETLLSNRYPRAYIQFDPTASSVKVELTAQNPIPSTRERSRAIGIARSAFLTSPDIELMKFPPRRKSTAIGMLRKLADNDEIGGDQPTLVAVVTTPL